MKKFWSYISNNQYYVGCTGGTVYIYDKAGTELAKFKDIKYGYNPVISPKGDILVVKSTEGRLAIYSLETMSLIKKFRFSRVDGAQDDGYCFSADGKYFYNVERQGSSTNSAISMYDTTDFKRVCMWLEEDEIIEPQYIEAEAYSNFKSLELMGFTDMAKRWSGFRYIGVDMTGIENEKKPLKELWEKYHEAM